MMRRYTIKKWLFGLFIGCMLVFSMSTNAADVIDKKTLIVYFSLTGNTDYLAKVIQNKTNADIYRIRVKTPYPIERADLLKRVKKEQDTGNYPDLKSLPNNIDAYDQILIGSPVWFRSVSTPISSLLKQVDFKAKKVAAFCTCGSKSGNFFSDFKKQAKNVTILQGFELCRFHEKKDEILNEALDVWLKKISQ